MIRAASPLLLAMLALSACDGARHGDDAGANVAGMNEQQAAASEQRAPDATTVMAERWSTMFANPARIVAAANDFGYKVDGYTAANDGYVAGGTPQVLPKDHDGATVKTSFVATGTGPDRVHTITFTFDTRVTGKPGDPEVRKALDVPRQVVGGFLGRFELGPDDAIKRGMNELTPATHEEYGVRSSVRLTPTGNGPYDRRMVVTFTDIGLK